MKKQTQTQTPADKQAETQADTQAETPAEITLRFSVPAAARVALAAEMARGSSALQHLPLAATHADPEGGGLAAAGLACQVCRTTRRTTRRIRTRGAWVEVVFDEGRPVAAGATQGWCGITFKRCAGPAPAVLALAQRWCKRFGLVYDPRSKAEQGEQGERLAGGPLLPPLRKAERPVYGQHAGARPAFAAVLDECLAQITHNAIGLSEGDPALRAAHVHQLRVGIRRLRCALRSFRGWVPVPPAALETDLRTLFATLGRVRDLDVLDSGVVAALAEAGAPALAPPRVAACPDGVATVAAPQTQQSFLAWIAWRAGLHTWAASGWPPQPLAGGAGAGAAAEGVPAGAAEAPPPDLRRSAAKRLQNWHARIAADGVVFDALDEASLHALRKRIKRQRYATEFLAPLLRRRQVDRYLRALSVVQDRMGALNDLFVARAHYQAMVASDAAAWFALGWLAARIAEGRARAKPALERLGKLDAPAARRGRAPG